MLINYVQIGEIVQVTEGSEPSEFWNLLGSQNERPKIPISKKRRSLRLFEFSNATGVVAVEEIYNFCQGDLVDSSVMMLDAEDCVYCWYGEKSPHVTRHIALETALVNYSCYSHLLLQEYAKKNSATVWVVRQYYEPIEFAMHFQAWGTIKFKAQIDKSIQPKLENGVELFKQYSRKTYSYAQLLASTLPPGVDETKLETYLSEEEFVEVFKMERAAFQKLPQFRQIELKKKVYLF
jgi:hypothetical protein